MSVGRCICLLFLLTAPAFSCVPAHSESESTSWQEWSARAYGLLKDERFLESNRGYEKALACVRAERVDADIELDLIMDSVSALLGLRSYQSAVDKLLNAKPLLLLAAKNQPLIASRYFDRLSAAYCGLGNFDKALIAAKESLFVQEKLFPKNCQQVISKRIQVLSVLCWKNDCQGALLAAQQMFEEARRARDTVAESHIHRALDALTKSQVPRLKSGLRIYPDRADFRKFVHLLLSLSPGNRDVREIENNLAHCDFAQSEKLLSRLTHPSRKQLLSFLPVASRALADVVEASSNTDLRRRAVAIARRTTALCNEVLGPSSRETVQFGSYLVILLADSDNYSEAISEIAKIEPYAVAAAKGGGDTPTSHARLQIAHSCMRKARLDLAREQMLRQRQIHQQLALPDSFHEAWQLHEQHFGLSPQSVRRK